MTKKYNEFIQMKPTQMAQTISDMTYCYKNTVVPKEHYKKILDETIEEEMTEMFNYEMLGLVYKNLKHFYDESPQLFFKALVCIFKKVKPTDMRPQEQKAIVLVTDELFTNPKRYTVLNEELMDYFDDIKNDVDVVVETKSLS